MRRLMMPFAPPIILGPIRISLIMCRVLETGSEKVSTKRSFDSKVRQNMLGLNACGGGRRQGLIKTPKHWKVG